MGRFCCARALSLGLTLAIDLGGGLVVPARVRWLAVALDPQNWVVFNRLQNWAV